MFEKMELLIEILLDYTIMQIELIGYCEILFPLEMKVLVIARSVRVN
jgi:hypothetical protein